MSEPDVTLTDYGLALECAFLAAFLAVRPKSQKVSRRAGICFFAFFGIAAAIGGTVHGFFPEQSTLEHHVLWQLTLLSIGLAAFSSWTIGARLLATGRTGHWLALAAFPQIVLYCVGILFFTQEFWIVFTIYLPAALLLLAGFCCSAWRDGHRFLLVGASGSILSLFSSFLQFMRIGIDPVYFNHNAVAHVVQAVALALIFLGIRYLSSPDFLDSRVARGSEISPP